ncbi:hypothetical protein [uncultured Jatrophihabitans sp.]|uniref:hypothetical protein n=1 Tax=uncultured Jatrophihabitans sp. TaxID=1610747 RepID=UPI0035CBC71B
MIVVVALVVAAAAAVRGVWSPCGLSMLSALNPMSERARGHRFGGTVAWYVAGAAVGGGLLGAGCALVASGVGRLPLTERWTWAVVLGAATVAVLSDSALTRFALPVHPRQVDERWLSTYRRWIYAGGFGLQIGTGFATYVMTAAVYLTATLAALTGSAGHALLVGLVFGTVRGLAILLAAGARTPDALRALMAAIDRRATTSLLTVAALEAAVGAGAAWFVGGPLAAGAVALALGTLTAWPSISPGPGRLFPSIPLGHGESYWPARRTSSSSTVTTANRGSSTN